MELPYQYRPVDSRAHKCRVLELLPGSFNDDITISLRSNSLRSRFASKYDAISYTWNDEPRCEKIYVKPGFSAFRWSSQPRRFLLATPNLVNALRHLRKTDESRTLWADAICINQDDLTERGEQVALMTCIFRKVAHLWIWLGPEADDSDLAIETLRWWYTRIEPNLTAELVGDFRLREPIDDADRWIIDDSPHQQPQISSRCIESLRALFSRSWYERLWVQQEIHLTRGRATFVCGSSTISSEEFNGAVPSVMLRLLEKDFMPVNQEWWEKRLSLLWALSHPTYDEPLPELVRRTQFTKCTDPRDKIYGVLGLLPPSDQDILKSLKPDYHIDVMALYERVSHLYIEATHELPLLRFCDSSRTEPSLPTWAVNWNTSTRRVPIDEQYAAALSFDTKIEIKDHVLLTHGIITTTITDTEPFGTSSTSMALEEATAAIRVLRDRFMDSSTAYTADRCKRAIALMLLEIEVYEHQYYIEKPEFLEDARLSKFIDELDRIFEGSDALLPETVEFEMIFGDGSSILSHLPAIAQQSVIKTSNGFVGIAPFYTQAGDAVAVLVGLENPVVLRPRTSGRNEVVGIAFVHGLNWGEAFLGDFQDGWSYQQWTCDDGTRLSAFRNTQTDETTDFDPRIDWEQLVVASKGKGLVDERGRYFKQPDTEYFLNNGVDLKTIEIV